MVELVYIIEVCDNNGVSLYFRSWCHCWKRLCCGNDRPVNIMQVCGNNGNSLYMLVEMGMVYNIDVGGNGENKVHGKMEFEPQ